MRADNCTRIKEYFASKTRDLTPVSSPAEVKLLYTRFSRDPGFTRLCSVILSEFELQRADRFTSMQDQARFIQRRAFRRYCGALALCSVRPLSQIIFAETDKGRPWLGELPDTWFSFSSCSLGFIGAWSSTHALGVDIEERSGGIEVIELARQFFSAAEAKVIEKADDEDRLQTFYQYWVLKESALKSIGEGLPFGLDGFRFELAPSLQVVQVPSDVGKAGQFDAHLLEGTSSCAALVTRKLA